MCNINYESELTRDEYLLYFRTIDRRDGRVVEGAPLLREYGSKAHRGFESLSLRQINAPVAQLDRVSGYEPGGRRFESFRARHFSKKNNNNSKKETNKSTNLITRKGSNRWGSTKCEAKSAKRGEAFWTRFSAPRRGEEEAKATDESILRYPSPHILIHAPLSKTT